MDSRAWEWLSGQLGAWRYLRAVLVHPGSLLLTPKLAVELSLAQFSLSEPVALPVSPWVVLLPEPHLSLPAPRTCAALAVAHVAGARRDCLSGRLTSCRTVLLVDVLVKSRHL